MKFYKRIHPIKKGLASTDYYGLIKNCKFVKGKIYTVQSTYSPIYSEKKLKNLTKLIADLERFSIDAGILNANYFYANFKRK